MDRDRDFNRMGRGWDRLRRDDASFVTRGPDDSEAWYPEDHAADMRGGDMRGGAERRGGVDARGRGGRERGWFDSDGFDRQRDWARGRGEFWDGGRRGTSTHPRDWNRSGSYGEMVATGSGWMGDRGVGAVGWRFGGDLHGGGRFGSDRFDSDGFGSGQHEGDRWGASDWMEQAGRERNARRFRDGGSSGRGRGSQGSFVGRGPSGYQRSTERILEDANEALTWAGDVDASDIEVSVDGGEVTLDGVVDSRRAKRAAEEAVEDVRGVRDVHNRLRVQPRDEQLVTPESDD